MRTLGVPYPEGYEEQAVADLQKQAQEIADRIQEELPDTPGISEKSDREIMALIAYLQRLGVDITKEAADAPNLSTK
ncbi:MAG: cbb3-type cytochrome c oxidase subunit II [Bacteroidota bacterium]